MDYGRVDLDTASPIIAPSGVAYESIATPELARAYERIDTADFLGLFVNGYWDMPNRSRFTPFVGATWWAATRAPGSGCAIASALLT